MVHGRFEVLWGVSTLGGLVRMLYDKLLFVANAEVDVVAGSRSMHTLHSFIWSGLLTLAFSVITTRDFTCTLVVLAMGCSRFTSLIFMFIVWSMVPSGFGLGTQVLKGFRICFTSPNTHSRINTSSKWHWSRISFRSPGKGCWIVLYQWYFKWMRACLRYILQSR